MKYYFISFYHYIIRGSYFENYIVAAENIEDAIKRAQIVSDNQEKEPISAEEITLPYKVSNE